METAKQKCICSLQFACLSICRFPSERSMLHERSALQKHSTPHAAKTWKNTVPICDKTANYCCIFEASSYSPKLSSFLTFQSVSATISPHHNVKLKVGHGVISRSDCSPPPNPWEMETKIIFQVKKNNNEITGISIYFLWVYIWNMRLFVSGSC